MIINRTTLPNLYAAFAALSLDDGRLPLDEYEIPDMFESTAIAAERGLATLEGTRLPHTMEFLGDDPEWLDGQFAGFVIGDQDAATELAGSDPDRQAALVILGEFFEGW